MNPYGDDLIVDQVIGSAYQVVKYVAANMTTLIELSDFIQFVSKEGLLELIEAVPELTELHAHLTELLAIHTNLAELLALEVNLPMLTVIYNMLPELQEIYDNLPAILDSSLSVAASREAIVRSYNEAGYPMDKTESFEVGGTITTAKETLLYEQNGVGYSWGGALPKVVSAGSTPSTTGGIGPTAWIDQSTKLLRQQLTAMSGNLNPAANWSDIPMYSDPELGGPDGPMNAQAKALAARSEYLRRLRPSVTDKVFAGGADATGVTPADAAFAAAAATNSTIYVPDGVYLLNANTPHGSWVVSAGASFTGVGLLKGGMLKIGKNITDHGGGGGRRWVNDADPVNLHRFNGRLFAGGSYKNNGLPNSVAGSEHSWIDDPAVTGILAGSLEQNAMAIAAVSDEGFNGIVTGVRASDAPFGASLGHTSMVLQDRASGINQGAWSGYFVGIKTAAAAAQNGINNVEMNLWNQKSDADGGPIDPYNFFPPSNMNNLWLSNGFPEVEVSRPSYRATCAIGILNNVADTTKAKYRAGIAFKATSLEGTDGVSGRGVALSLARGHSFQWYYGAGSAGPYISSNVDSNANGVQNVVFDNFGFLVRDTTGGATQFRVEAKANTVNYVRVSPNTAGGDVVVAAEGGDADINIRVSSKGAGQVISGATLRPNVANSYNCGTASFPWAGGFTQAAFTITSDENYKTAPLDITDAMLDAAAEVNWVRYQYLDRVEAKGPDGARWHFGAVAQRFVEAFERHGLDAHQYAFICYDEWGDQYEKVQTNEGEMVKGVRTVSRPVMHEINGELVPKMVQVYCLDEDGEPIFTADGTRKTKLDVVMEDVEEEYDTPAIPEYTEVMVAKAGSRYGIRYEEALALEAALQRRNYQRLLARVETLEAGNGI